MGWPTAMAFVSKGHEVCVVDNYLRRHLALATSSEALMPNSNLNDRAEIWKSIAGETMRTVIGDCTDYRTVQDVFRSFGPEVVVHYAEQPSAPYSMIDFDAAARVTLSNNLETTFNVIWAVMEHAPDCPDHKARHDV